MDAQINSPWVVYGFGEGPTGIGRVFFNKSEKNPLYSKLYIACGENRPGQTYPILSLNATPEAQRFDSPIGAIKYFLSSIEERGGSSISKLFKMLTLDFPAAIAQEILKNNCLAQGSPKCTLPTPEALEAEHDRWLATPRGEYNGFLNLPK